MAAATAAYAAAAAVLGGARLPTAASAAPRNPSLLLPPPPRGISSLFLPLASSSRFPDAHRFSSLQMKATSSSEETSTSADDLLEDLKQKWDAIENKSTIFLYGGGAIVAVWLSSIVVGAINSVPLLPKLMELVGLGYTGWFVYRYLLFKQRRKELVNEIEVLKKKIAGSGE
ncbi:protein CURVATURE THYLAKOID 1A, chloroplastic-like [Phoenix dactylifera]|uniref:Protein CURVATURE THYLAKOID 1A, chloroplastic-like n=1 Tax=Phoenix dactylifera TaxID=42345 RepID=A0A8B7CJX7_PHODC|nr:protein CURVATURE THYLAKOID 1A, chloroplastic-like [Phoenix dactylifera]